MHRAVGSFIPMIKGCKAVNTYTHSSEKRLTRRRPPGSARASLSFLHSFLFLSKRLRTSALCMLSLYTCEVFVCGSEEVCVQLSNHRWHRGKTRGTVMFNFILCSLFNFYAREIHRKKTHNFIEFVCEWDIQRLFMLQKVIYIHVYTELPRCLISKIKF